MSETEEHNSVDQTAFDGVRAEVRRVAGERPMTQVAREADVAYGTWAAFMGGSYKGNNQRVAEAAARWIEAQATKSAMLGRAVSVPGYIETRTATAVVAALRTAQHEPTIATVTGASGVGKTTAIHEYRRRTPNVFLLTGEPCFSTPRMVLDCLADALDVAEKYSSQTVSRAIQRRLAGKGALIVVDEAQHLSVQRMDQMRTLYDLAGVGIALVGNEAVATRVDGHARQAHFAQLFRRVGMRVKRNEAPAADIDALIDAWGVTARDERAVLTAIGRKPGALGNVTMVMKRAHMLAGEAGVDAAMLHRAWRSISDTKLLLAEAA